MMIDNPAFTALDNPYLIAVGGPVRRHEPENDVMLAEDLRKTIDWLEEAIQEYTELEGKLEKNDGWFRRNSQDHPNWETSWMIFDHQRERARELLLRMKSLCEVGLGEHDRLSGHADRKERFLELERWVREKRYAVATEEGAPF